MATKTSLCGVIAIAFAFAAAATTAAVPQFINYQGRVAVGSINFNGTGQFKFALVNGSGTTLWTNDGTASGEPANAVSLTVTNGLYSVLLGDTTVTNMTAIPATAFTGGDARLRIWFNDGTHGSQMLSPDQKFGTVPYALIAATVPDGAIGPAQLGTGTINGTVGCNTTNPEQAIVFIAGKSIQAYVGPLNGSTYPYQLINVPAGLQTVTARLGSGITATQITNVVAGETTTLDFPFAVTTYADTDGDGHGAGSPQTSCTVPIGRVTNNDDCNDNCATCFPGATEVCDTKDNDCDTQVDEGFNLGTDINNCGTCGHSCIDGLSCTTDVCTVGACSNPIQSNTCLIGGTCYSSGQSTGTCQTCQPSQSQTSGTSTPGATCGVDSCSGSTFTHGTCNTSGNCVSGNTSCSPYVCNPGGTGCLTSCTTSSDCVAGFSCAGSVCKIAQGGACSLGSQCASGFCTDGVCCNNACNSTCQACNLAGTVGTCTNIPSGQDPANECAGTLSCNGAGACQLATGSACSSNSQCATGFCTDGVCCASACTGVCEKCNLAGQLGTCAAVSSGQDPDNECPQQPASTCGTTGVCSGTRACQLYPSGTVCAAATCTGSTLSSADTCNGFGTCFDNGTTSCAPYNCNGAGTACLTSCSTSGDCVSGFTCAGSVCKKSQGSTCTTGSECASGFCTDGFCCNTACNSLCQACSAGISGGPNGTCTNIPAGTDPENECSGGTPNCNGAGACGP